jgi:hypothetical protein
MSKEQLVEKLLDVEQYGQLTMSEACKALDELGAGSHNITFTKNNEPVLIVAMAKGPDAKRLKKVMALLDDLAEIEGDE